MIFLLLDGYAVRIYNTIFHFHSLHTRHIRKSQKHIGKSQNEAGVKVAMKPVHTIGESLPSPKDPLTLEKKLSLSSTLF